MYDLLWFIVGVAVYTGRETKVRDNPLQIILIQNLSLS